MILLALAGCSGDQDANPGRASKESGSVTNSNGTNSVQNENVRNETQGAKNERHPEIADEIFIDYTAECGLEFVHYNGISGEYTLPEVSGSGCALFDYDNDGDLDLYLVQGAVLEGTDHPDAVAWTGKLPPRDRLLQNNLGKNGPRFTDVTEQSGIRAEGYGMGVATGDYNNDGWVDLYITNLGSNQLWRNNADGTFTNVAEAANVDDPHWSSSATFVDYDRDGNLDLYVANYVDFSMEYERECFSTSTARDFCGPNSYDPVSDTLFRNLGDGKFEDATARAGISSIKAPGLGVIAADLNGDGWTDLCVANDGQPNQLWINQKGNGTFHDESLLSGVAVNRMGVAEAGMGVDAADFDGDGDFDLVMMHLQEESNTLYVNQGDEYFEDSTINTGLHAPSLRFTAFGGGFLDFDNDGWLDVLAVNGAVRIVESLMPHPWPLHQTNQLFRNDGTGNYRDVTANAGKAFEISETSRGAALGDVDNDGDTDVVILNNNGPARLLLNNAGDRQHWLGLRVLHEDGLRDALQARVEVVSGEQTSLWRRVYTDGSYCSARDPRVLLGLASNSNPQTVRIYWSDGKSDEFRDLSVDSYWQIRRGHPPEKEQVPE